MSLYIGVFDNRWTKTYSNNWQLPYTSFKYSYIILSPIVFSASKIMVMNKNKTMDEVTEGHVMIFPSFLLHYAQPSVKNRIIISFDVICHYERTPLILQQL